MIIMIIHSNINKNKINNINDVDNNSKNNDDRNNNNNTKSNDTA